MPSILYNVHLGERRPFTQLHGPIEVFRELREGETIILTITLATRDPNTGFPWKPKRCRILKIDGNQITALPLN